jgi:chromosome segregation ATPase
VSHDESGRPKPREAGFAEMVLPLVQADAAQKIATLESQLATQAQALATAEEAINKAEAAIDACPALKDWGHNTNPEHHPSRVNNFCRLYDNCVHTLGLIADERDSFQAKLKEAEEKIAALKKEVGAAFIGGTDSVFVDLQAERDSLKGKLKVAEELMGAAVLGKSTAEHRVAEVCVERNSLRSKLEVAMEALKQLTDTVESRFEGLEIVALVPQDLAKDVKRARAALAKIGAKPTCSYCGGPLNREQSCQRQCAGNGRD